MKKVQNWAFFTPKRAKLRSHVAHTNYGRTHAHRTHVLKAFSHAHRTRASVRARVRVRIFFRNSQFENHGTFSCSFSNYFTKLCCGSVHFERYQYSFSCISPARPGRLFMEYLCDFYIAFKSILLSYVLC